MKIVTGLLQASNLILFLVSLLFTGCTGGSASKPYDGEFVQGRVPKTFIKTASPISVTAVVTEGTGLKTTKVQIESGKVTASTDIDPTLVQLSADGTVLVIRGEGGIYELSKIGITEIVSAGAKPPVATVDSYCINATEAGFAELRVQKSNGIYSFVGVNGTEQTNIGGDSSIVKGENHQYVQYQKDSFGSMVVDKANALPTDSAFFKAFFHLQTDNSLQSVKSMYCHLNNVPTGINQYTLWDSFAAPNNTPLVGHTANSGQVWTAIDNLTAPVIASNQVTTAPGSIDGTWANAITDAGASDFILTVDFNNNVLFWNTVPVVHFRYVDSSNNWYAMFDNSVHTFSIVEVVGGVKNVRAQASMGSLNVGSLRWLVSLNGPNISTTLSTTTLSYSSSSLQNATKVGLQVTGPTGFNSFSNLKIVSLQNAPNLVGSQPLPIDFHTMFVTSVPYSGNLGGLSGADARCADRAAHGTETISVGGTWKAILSTTTANGVTGVNAKDRISLMAGAPIKNTQGGTIIANATDLWTGILQSAPGYDEYGSFSQAYVWTGGMSMSGGDTCGNWLDGTHSPSGTTGFTLRTDSMWRSGSSMDGCDNGARLYCINVNN